MGTRCQVKVDDGQDQVTLYHHYDGYPENIIPQMMSAYDFEFSGNNKKRRRDFDTAGTVSSLLCAVDPTQFEPEAGHALHGDIEYYYILYVTRGGWLVDIYQPKKNRFMETSKLSDLQKKVSRAPLPELYAEIVEQERRKG